MGDLTILAPAVMQALMDLGVDLQALAALLPTLRRDLDLPDDASPREAAAMVFCRLPTDQQVGEGRRRIEDWVARGQVRANLVDGAEPMAGSVRAPAPEGAAQGRSAETLAAELGALIARARQVHAERSAAFREIGNRVTETLERIATGLDLESDLIATVRHAARQAHQDPVKGYFLELAQDMVEQLNGLGRVDLIPRDLGEVFEDIDLYAGR